MAPHDDYSFEEKMNNDATNGSYSGAKNLLVSVAIVIVAILVFITMNEKRPTGVPDDAPLKDKMMPYHAAAQQNAPDAGVVEQFRDFMFNSKLHGKNLNIYESQDPVSFYHVRKGEDGIENTFLDMTISHIKSADGELIAKIDDVLVDKKTGRATYILYSDNDEIAEDGYNYINYNHVKFQENDGDLQLTLSEDYVKNTDKISYSESDILEKFISLKYLRQGQVLDTFGETVGNIHAVIYNNATVRAIYFLLDPSFATGKDRLINIPFDASYITLNDGGLDLQLTTEQTEHLAKTVLNKKASKGDAK